MGQQQLLVIVMTVVVAMASMAMGLQAFQEGQRKANIDAMMDDAVIITGDIQAWRMQPAPLGGGKGADLDGFSLTSIKYETTADDEYITQNGTFTAYVTDGVLIVQGDNTDYDGRVLITVNGEGSSCMRANITDTSDSTTADPSDHPSCSGF